MFDSSFSMADYKSWITNPKGCRPALKGKVLMDYHKQLGLPVVAGPGLQS